MLRLFASDAEIKEWEERYRKGGTGYGHTKKRLVELMHEFFRPYRAKRKEYEDNPGEVEKILLDGAERAREVARGTIDEVRLAVGFRAMG
jgi:tryptophanyl-tRNA synthetase